MTTLATLILATLTVVPTDRLAMADRLFNRGKYAQAKTEYEALKDAPGIATDEILYRLAECERASGDNAMALNHYAEVAMKYPESLRAGHARFMCAMGASGKQRIKMLMALDSDRIDLATRTAALYHLGVETGSLEAFAKCVKLSPNGKYADFANLRRGTAMVKSAIQSERRKGVEILLGIAFSKSSLAGEAMYLAAIQSYRDKKYGEAGTLFRRYRKVHAKGEHAEEALTMGVWCDFMEGRYSDASVACGEGKTDDLAYIKAASAYATGDNETAIRLFRKYLEDFPQGKYRADAELPIARMEFDVAQKASDGSKTIEAAKRGFSLSKLAADELRLAWSYEKAGKNEEAKEEFLKIAKNYPKTEEAAEALYRKALIDARAERWASVELALAESLGTGHALKFKASALYWRGVAAMKLAHDAEGAEYLRDAIALGLTLDESREARLMLADYDFREERTDAAKKAYDKLVREGATERMNAAHLLAVGKLLGGEAGMICAKALVKIDSPEWRQAGWALAGDIEERGTRYTAAIDAYRKSLAEPVKTEEAAAAALKLGRLETRAGEYAKADETLKQAVTMNADNVRVRAEAYLALARNAEAKGDFTTACAYATVVTSLFDDEEICGEAKKVLKAHPEAVE